MAQANKFWIVEYVDVNAPKAERSEICLDKSDARHRAFKRGGIVHFSSLEDFVGGGFCDSIKSTGLFDNELEPEAPQATKQAIREWIASTR